MKHSFSRRQFLAVAGVAVASPLVIPRHVLGQDGKPGANDTIKIALIGLGGRCIGLYQNDVKQAAGGKVVAVCDFWPARVSGFMNRFKDDFKPEQAYDDFRKMIEKEKPDGVMAETATHQRAWTAAIAMQMGCHAYIEKEMCLTIEEGRYLVNCARKYKRVTQIGSQQRSLPLSIWACEQVQKGVLGKISVVEAPNFVGPFKWEDKPGEDYIHGITDEIWDLWLNQTVYRPFHRELLSWPKWWDYAGGGLSFGVTGWGTHSYDQINMALGTSETGPVEIILDEPVEDRYSRAGENKTNDLIGPRAKMRMWFADGIELRLTLDSDRGPGLGCIVIGEKGKMEINRHRITSNPKEITADIPDEAQDKLSESIYHVENWINCIKTGEKCTADVEYGHRATTLCELVNIVRATAPVGEKIGWDPVKERFTNNDKGNAMLSRPRRKGYELPELT